MSGKFELTKNRHGLFSLSLKAANGQVVMTSQTFNIKEDAEFELERIRRCSLLDHCYDRRLAPGGQPFFSLLDEAGARLGKSTHYASTAAMEKGIASVKRNAAAARMLDLSDYF